MISSPHYLVAKNLGGYFNGQGWGNVMEFVVKDPI